MLRRVQFKRCVYFLFFVVIVVRYFLTQTAPTVESQLKYVKSLPELDCFALHGFNECLSDQISVERSIPDLRSSYCKSANFNRTLNVAKTSVIMTFHNEAWSTLLRSFHSVLNRSPEYLIEEVILIDDFSNMGES